MLDQMIADMADVPTIYQPTHFWQRATRLIVDEFHADMKSGDAFTKLNVRSIRPGHGLPPRYMDDVLQWVARREIARGTPLSWELVG